MDVKSFLESKKSATDSFEIKEGKNSREYSESREVMLKILIEGLIDDFNEDSDMLWNMLDNINNMKKLIIQFEQILISNGITGNFINEWIVEKLLGFR